MKKAFFQLHIAILLAGFTAILGKVINLNEGYLVAYRMLISAVALGIILLVGKRLVLLPFKSMLKLFGVGAIIALHWVTFYGSIKYSNVSVAVTCLSAIGFFTSILEPAIRRRRIDKAEVLLGLLGIAGIYIIFNFNPAYKIGIIFGITSAMLASLFPIYNKLHVVNFAPKVVTFYEMSGGFIALCFLLPLYLLFFPVGYAIPTQSDWLWLLVLSLACTVFAFILSLNSLKYLSAFTTNLSFNLEPVYSIILAFIIFDEGKFLDASFYYGLALILLAVVLQMFRVYNGRNKRIKMNLKLGIG